MGHNDAVHFSLLMANERDAALLQMRPSCPHSRPLSCQEVSSVTAVTYFMCSASLVEVCKLKYHMLCIVNCFLINLSRNRE